MSSNEMMFLTGLCCVYVDSDEEGHDIRVLINVLYLNPFYVFIFLLYEILN